MENTITINAILICEFHSFEHWVNKATSKIGGIRENKEVLICVDKLGNACHIGEDFMAARDHDRFPVKAYIIPRSSKVKD